MAIKKNMTFSDEKIQQWQSIWRQICNMAYLRQDIVEEIRVEPESEVSGRFYEENSCLNKDLLTLDYMWEIYSKKYPDVQVVPELKYLYVSKALFESLGIKKWFSFSFRNCVVELW